MTKRLRDTVGLARLIVDMAIGEVPSDTPEVLAEMNGQQEPPKGRAKGAKARAESQTPERRREVARKAAAARWEGRAGQAAAE